MTEIINNDKKLGNNNDTDTKKDLNKKIKKDGKCNIVYHKILISIENINIESEIWKEYTISNLL